VPPSLATLRAAPPQAPEWIHEIKLDGYRIEARLDRGKVRLLTRKALDWTHRFERIAKAVATLPADTTPTPASRTARRQALLFSVLVVSITFPPGHCLWRASCPLEQSHHPGVKLP